MVSLLYVHSGLPAVPRDEVPPAVPRYEVPPAVYRGLGVPPAVYRGLGVPPAVNTVMWSLLQLTPLCGSLLLYTVG